MGGVGARKGRGRKVREMAGVKVWGGRVGVEVQVIADGGASARFDRTPAAPRGLGTYRPRTFQKMARERRGLLVRVIAKRCAVRPRRRRGAWGARSRVVIMFHDSVMRRGGGGGGGGGRGGGGGGGGWAAEVGVAQASRAKCSGFTYDEKVTRTTTHKRTKKRFFRRKNNCKMSRNYKPCFNQIPPSKTPTPAPHEDT